jgi:hypothetical protein
MQSRADGNAGSHYERFLADQLVQGLGSDCVVHGGAPGLALHVRVLSPYERDAAIADREPPRDTGRVVKGVQRR